jgi:hypothetical protein
VRKENASGVPREAILMNGQRVPLRSVPGRGFRGAVLLALPSPGQTDRLAGFADRERGRAQNGGLVHCHRNSVTEIRNPKLNR